MRIKDISWYNRPVTRLKKKEGSRYVIDRYDDFFLNEFLLNEIKPLE